MRNLLPIALLSTGCVPVPGRPESPEPLQVLGLSPREGVGLVDPVQVSLSRGLPEGSAPDLSVWRMDGSSVSAAAVLAADRRSIALTPVQAWPEGQWLRVVVGPSLADELGRPALSDPEALRFATQGSLQVAPLQIRWPHPGRAAPISLATMVVQGGLPADVEALELEADGDLVRASVVQRSDGGLARLRIPERSAGACQRLCPSRRYQLRAPTDEVRVAEGVFGTLETSTVSDVLAPALTATSVLVRGEALVAEVETNEPVLLYAELGAADGDPIGMAAPIVPEVSTYVEPTLPLLPDTDYELRIQGEDGSGRVLAPFVLRGRTPPRIDVSISELVPKPLHDWGDSDGLGAPFDDRPGSGTVSDADEWVELVNRSAVPLDLGLAALSLRVIDSSPTETSVEAAPALHFGDGGSATHWYPGEALVVRPRGTMAQRGFALELYTGLRLLDRVVVGDAPDADARSANPPDLSHEALARDLAGRLVWCTPTPGEPSPSVDCLRQ